MTTTCILYGAIEEFVFTGRKVVRMVHFRAIQLEKRRPFGLCLTSACACVFR